MEDLIIEQHPDYEKLNSNLLKESEGVIYDWSDITYVRGKMSEWHICGKYIDVIKEWVKTLTPSIKGMIPRIIDAWYARYDMEIMRWCIIMETYMQVLFIMLKPQRVHLQSYFLTRMKPLKQRREIY